ncbi:hypothetical protein [Paenibacillus sp. YN15]|uniref:hypothetical protein n=1 Tax=Paenibacillus sp. YN15 TaxID=1742774 RepID=UPI000DCE7784|nr:hypothetical protein [Paenibacillus sp. YN15]RAV04563.1 hypothetical protein DQG13_04925 [Paenibacillus sp. YN15]
MLVRDIEKCLAAAEQKGVAFGSRALGKGALVHLCRRLEAGRSYHILELGGGMSPYFWDQVAVQDFLSVSLFHIEHDPGLASLWEGQHLGKGSFHFYNRPLKQLSDEERTEVFANPETAWAVWGSYGQAVPQELFNHYTIRNAFYADIETIPLEPASVDVLILDGPHGNGRSLAFPLLYGRLKRDALVLIDDYDHYPFVEDLRSLFQMEELAREPRGEYRWLLCRLTGKE